jgi:hypothetical protein
MRAYISQSISPLVYTSSIASLYLPTNKEKKLKPLESIKSLSCHYKAGPSKSIQLLSLLESHIAKLYYIAFSLEVKKVLGSNLLY